MTTLQLNNSERINMFLPLSTNDKVNAELEKVLNLLNYGIIKLCPLILERIARRTAGIIYNKETLYSLTLEEIEELYSLNDLKKSFGCKKIDILELINSFEETYTATTDNNGNTITDENNNIITLTL